MAAARLLTGTPDLEILAARALATAPLPRLAALPAGTGAAWHAGDPEAVRALAALELRRLGLRLPEGGARRRHPRLTGRAGPVAASASTGAVPARRARRIPRLRRTC